MSWSPDLYIGEMRPWPESVTVRRGNESKAYVPLDSAFVSYDEERDILSVVSKHIPNEVRVTKIDQRERDVYTARVYTFVPERLRKVLDKLGKENDKLWEYVKWLEDSALRDPNYYRDLKFEIEMKQRELGIEVDE